MIKFLRQKALCSIDKEEIFFNFAKVLIKTMFYRINEVLNTVL
jgi:hypothetical protein